MRAISLCLTAALAATSLPVQAEQTPPDPALTAQVAANFDRADTDKDGKLTKAEFMTTPRGKPPNDPDQTFKVSDVNGDGAVSKAEFTAMLNMQVVTQAPTSAPKAK